MEAKKGLPNKQYELSLYEVHVVQFILLILHAPAVLVVLYLSEVLHMRLLQCEGLRPPGTKAGCGVSVGIFWYVEFQRCFL